MDEFEAIASEVARKYGRKEPSDSDYNIACKTERELRAIRMSGEIEEIEENWFEYSDLSKRLSLMSKIKQLKYIKKIRQEIEAKREALRLLDERAEKNYRRAKNNRRLEEFAG